MADKTVTKVVQYVLVNWVSKRMTIYPDIISPAIFVAQLPQLRYENVEIIMGRHYHLKLKKEPIVFWMKELCVQWLPHLDRQDPPECLATTTSNKIVPHASGFYRVIIESSEDHEFLIRLQIIRV